MTKKQLSVLLAPLAVRYPLSFAVNAATVALWAEILGDMDFEPCRDAVFEWLSSAKEFAPGPGDIKQMVSMQTPETREVTFREHSYVIKTTRTNPETRKREEVRREYVRSTPEERWWWKKHLAKLGYCQVEIEHGPAIALAVVPIKNCVETGRDCFEGESMPKYSLV